jgi:hypothetical protein
VNAFEVGQSIGQGMACWLSIMLLRQLIGTAKAQIVCVVGGVCFWLHYTQATQKLDLAILGGFFFAWYSLEAKATREKTLALDAKAEAERAVTLRQEQLEKAKTEAYRLARAALPNYIAVPELTNRFGWARPTEATFKDDQYLEAYGSPMERLRPYDKIVVCGDGIPDLPFVAFQRVRQLERSHPYLVEVRKDLAREMRTKRSADAAERREELAEHVASEEWAKQHAAVAEAERSSTVSLASLSRSV